MLLAFFQIADLLLRILGWVVIAQVILSLLVAFNVLYRAGSNGGQTSSAFMLGRETKTDKLGPLRADLGPKVFGNLGSRPLEIGVRT